jgi:dolichol-phosphate mannosyltransferase
VTPRIILPTYQERDSITGLLAELRRQLGPAARILVVDDGSPDGTAGLVQQVVARDPAVELFSRPGKLGLASADQTALRRVLDENRDDCVVTMDADFSHHPRYVPPLVGAAAAYDLVIGSRYVAGGGIDNWDARRRLLSLIGNWYARTVTGTPVHDLTAGLTCMRTDFLRTVPFERIEARGSRSRFASSSAASGTPSSRGTSSTKDWWSPGGFAANPSRSSPAQAVGGAGPWGAPENHEGGDRIGSEAAGLHPAGFRALMVGGKRVFQGLPMGLPRRRPVGGDDVSNSFG